MTSDYRGLRNKVTFFHKACGHYWSPRASNVVYQHQKCSCERLIQGKKRLEALCARHHLQLLSDYKGAKSNVLVKAECGHTFKREPTNLYRNWKCPYEGQVRAPKRPSNLGQELLQWKSTKTFSNEDIARLVHVRTQTIIDLERGWLEPTPKLTESIKRIISDS